MLCGEAARQCHLLFIGLRLPSKQGINQYLLPRKVKAKRWVLSDPPNCFQPVLHLSPLDFSNLFFFNFTYHAIIINISQRMSFNVLPIMLGTLMPHLASMPRITAPRFSSPLLSIHVVFEIKEEIKGKSL